MAFGSVLRVRAHQRTAGDAGLRGSADRPGTLPVPHPDFFRAASASSGEIVLNDAKLRLALETQGPEALCARVIVGGAILARKGITYTASTYRQESLGDNDQAVLRNTRQLAGIRYAVSYVKDAVEMAHYRVQIGSSAHLIAKLERQPALDEAAQIAESADELWLCRGDLGAELGEKVMAEAVHRFSEGVGALPVPVLLAGQVFEHMTEHATPTRSELCGAYDALMTGYRGFVLSDETAIGRDPVGSCRAAALFRGERAARRAAGGEICVTTRSRYTPRCGAKSTGSSTHATAGRNWFSGKAIGAAYTITASRTRSSTCCRAGC